MSPGSYDKTGEYHRCYPILALALYRVLARNCSIVAWAGVRIANADSSNILGGQQDTFPVKPESNREYQHMAMRAKELSTVREVFPGTRRYTQHTIFELSESIRERDIVTYEHCRRVAIYANRLARHMKWHRRAARELALAGLIHDLGKTWVHNSVLHKPTALSQAEYQEMQRHPAIAARILMTYDVSDELIAIVLHHHETYDGRGYPDHLAGDAIPLGARLLSVADVFDALTSARSYKAPLPLAEVRERIARSAGTMFDPAVAQAFIELLDADPDFQLASRAVPIPLDQIPGWDKHDAIE